MVVRFNTEMKPRDEFHSTKFDSNQLRDATCQKVM